MKNLLYITILLLLSGTTYAETFGQFEYELNHPNQPNYEPGTFGYFREQLDNPDYRSVPYDFPQDYGSYAQTPKGKTVIIINSNTSSETSNTQKTVQPAANKKQPTVKQKANIGSFSEEVLAKLPKNIPVGTCIYVGQQRIVEVTPGSACTAKLEFCMAPVACRFDNTWGTTNAICKANNHLCPDASECVRNQNQVSELTRQGAK